MDRNNNPDKKHLHLLNNAPCNKDLFEGRSHQDIANAICDTLHNQRNANIIGIDGGWGSGKSNLVGLVKDTLKQSYTQTIYHFFVYDAWGHQSDLQRRSILEELTDQLTNGDKNDNEVAILDKNKWDNRLRDLLARKREVETKSVPKLSCGVILSAFAVIATPILAVIADKFVNDACHKIQIMVIPLGLILMWFIIRLIVNVGKYKWKRLEVAIKATAADMFSLYSDKQIESKVNETISEKEPSSREFKKWIHKIDEDLNGNKLIIVFDNMDRLPATKVQELWAVIHSFFADEKYKNISVIVPFDRAHIISAFKNEDIFQNSSRGIETEDTEKVKPDDAANDIIKKGTLKTPEIKCYGNDFINKTFNIIYRVSPPTMSNWKIFFNEKWKEAFDKTLPDDSRITQIYDLLTEHQTPRKIIAFINEFVSLKQICFKHNIPDEYIALFIFGKSKIALSPETEIITPTYLGAMKFRYQDDKIMPKYICALYYQLPPEKAIDLIYTEAIKRALNENDSEGLNDIKVLPQFKNLLENAIAKVINIPNATMALNSCFGNEINDEIRKFWDDLYELTKKSFPGKLEEYQKILLQRVTHTNEYLKSIIREVSKKEHFNVSDYFKSISSLSKINGIYPFNLLETKDVKPEEFIQFVSLAKEDYSKYKIVCDKVELDTHLSGYDTNKLESLIIIPFIKTEYSLSEFERMISEKISQNSDNIDALNALYSRLKEFKRPIETILPEESIYGLLTDSVQNANHKFNDDLICMLMVKLNDFSSTQLSNLEDLLNVVSYDEESVESIAQKIEYYIDYVDFVTNTDSMEYSLYSTIANKITEKNYCELSDININSILNKYDTILSTLAIESKILMEKIGNKKIGSINKENINSVPVNFFEDTINLNNDLVISCQNNANEYLKCKTVDNWEDNIVKKTYDYQLFNILHPNLQNYFDAIKKLLLKYATGEMTTLDKETINKALEWAKENGISLLSTFNDIRDTFCNNLKMNTEYFDFYGEWLFEYAKLDEKKEVLRTIFKSDILSQDENIELILKNREKMLKIIENANNEKDDFINKIAQLLPEKYSEKPEFIDFARSIGIEHKQEEK